MGISRRVIKENETKEDALKREVKEECGLDLKSLQYIGKFERASKEKYVNVYLFHSNNFSSKIKLSKEHDKFKWATKDEILKMKPSVEIGIDTIMFFEKLKQDK